MQTNRCDANYTTLHSPGEIYFSPRRTQRRFFKLLLLLLFLVRETPFWRTFSKPLLPNDVFFFFNIIILNSHEREIHIIHIQYIICIVLILRKTLLYFHLKCILFINLTLYDIQRWKRRVRRPGILEKAYSKRRGSRTRGIRFPRINDQKFSYGNPICELLFLFL